MSDCEETGPDPDLVARAVWDGMETGNRANATLGTNVLDVGPGYATVAMTVTNAMANCHGMCHGGFVFALADTAFGYAANSRGDKIVTQHGTITFIRPVRVGDRLVASAHEVAREGRSGIYDVSVAAGEETVAEFRGHSRTTGGRWVE